jgi:two-component system OmpR family response regulator
MSSDDFIVSKYCCHCFVQNNIVLVFVPTRAGRLVPKTELEKLVLGFESELASNALEVHVSALRRKLGRELIETVRGLGYRVARP